MPKKKSLYLSLDIEADGPVPGLFSLLSVGLAGFVLDNGTGNGTDENDSIQHQLMYTHEVNLEPLPDAKQAPSTMEFWARETEAWNHVNTNKQDPLQAFQKLADEVEQLNKKYRVYVVGWPINFDWMWICYYFYRFVGHCPLGFSARCISSYAWAMAKTKNPAVDIGEFLEQFQDPNYPHTHKALDDAKEQGVLFMNMLIHNLNLNSSTS